MAEVCGLMTWVYATAVAVVKTVAICAGIGQPLGALSSIVLCGQLRVGTDHDLGFGLQFRITTLRNSAMKVRVGIGSLGPNIT